jgi:inorganic phosphate transporter, PiT family
MMEWSIFFLIALALVFDFLNGFHDSANAIATIVSTKVLTPRQAVIWAAFFDFIAVLFFSMHVANTVGKGIVDVSIMDSQLIFAALVGACAWDLITWYVGLPTSSSHALMGGLIGAALVKAGVSSLIWKGILTIVAFIFISPFLGLILGLLLGIIVHWLFRKKTPAQVDHWFRKGQLFSAALYSLGHGGNDAQKTMGVIAGLLISAGMLGVDSDIPMWVRIACNTALALGVMCGGWRIVKTMGSKVTKLKPVDGFCAESAAAISINIASALGVPVSTTHTITGSIMGVGSLRRLTAVRWGVAGKIVWAWIITIPCAAAISALTYALTIRF